MISNNLAKWSHLKIIRIRKKFKICRRKSNGIMRGKLYNLENHICATAKIYSNPNTTRISISFCLFVFKNMDFKCVIR